MPASYCYSWQVPNHLKLRAIVGQVQGDCVELRCEQEDHDHNEPLTLGHCFREVVLYEVFNPPLNYTNPWPLQIWCVNLQGVWSSEPVLYPGRSAFFQLRGSGFENIVTAKGLITKPTQGVGLR
jgi:hypothetical protein